MTNDAVLTRILSLFREYSIQDKELHKFLVNILMKEYMHPGRFRWKDEYIALLEELSGKRSEYDED